MKVVLNDYLNSENIEVEEFLEPQGASYQLRQGDKKINFEGTYQIKELIRALQFIIAND